MEIEYFLVRLGCRPSELGQLHELPGLPASGNGAMTILEYGDQQQKLLFVFVGQFQSMFVTVHFEITIIIISLDSENNIYLDGGER